jgi:hypothetical protein
MSNKASWCSERGKTPTVIPAQAGIQCVTYAEGAQYECFASGNELDSGFRRNDDSGISGILSNHR